MTHWTEPLAFLIGLCVGSFLNVVIHRLPDQILGSPDAPGLWRPRSHCPHCMQTLRARELVPILSWLWLRGRCASCATPIPWRYPLVELSSALLWLVCAWHWPDPRAALAWAVFGSLLLALAVIDWRTTLLPDALTQPLLWAGLLASLLGWITLPLPQAVWGAVTGYLALWSVATLFACATGKVGMGTGDFKLLAALGAWLGPLALLPLVLTASLVGVAVGLLMQQRSALREGGYLPFGPFLAAAGVALAFTGDTVMRWLGIA